jgi:hypothetical protein
MKCFPLEVLFGQIAVFHKGQERPFNDWTDEHVRQGFAWRPESVSFRSVVEAGLHQIEVSSIDHLGEVSPDAIRAIEVPFEVHDGGDIEIASIVDSEAVSVPVGRLLLRCEFFDEGVPSAPRVRLTFAAKEAPRFAVARADKELVVPSVLLVTAQPASS